MEKLVFNSKEEFIRGLMFYDVLYDEKYKYSFDSDRHYPFLITFDRYTESPLQEFDYKDKVFYSKNPTECKKWKLITHQYYQNKVIAVDAENDHYIQTVLFVKGTKIIRYKYLDIYFKRMGYNPYQDNTQYDKKGRMIINE